MTYLVVSLHTSFTVTVNYFCYPTILQPDVPDLFMPAFILYQSPSADTHYIVSARDFENIVNYFLSPGTSYQIQVSFCEFVAL